MLQKIKQKILPNGLKTICLKKSGAPITSVQVWYKTGSVNEEDGIRGISHFFEHMMFRGSEHVASEEHAQKINDVGGHCNAFTAEDVTAYLNSVPCECTEMVFQLEADRMSSLQITPDVLETERKVIIEEYHTYMNNPVAKAYLEFRREFYGSHPYALSPLGTLEDIKAISLDQCLAYYKNWYSPSNAVLVVVGAFDNENDIFDLAERYFGPIASPENSSVVQKNIPELPPIANMENAFMKHSVEFDVPILLSGYPAPQSSNPDALALEILQQVMSHGETGRMHREIVRKNSLAVMAGGMNHLLKRSGMSMFFAAFTPDVSYKKVAQALHKQVSIIREQGISSYEMDKVKNASLAGRIFEMYSAEHLCQRIGFAETVDGDYRIWVERLEALKKLNIDTLTEVAQRYWDDSRRRVLYLKPRKVKPLLFAVGILRRIFSRKK